MSFSDDMASFLKDSSGGDSASIYGRICTTADRCPPMFFSDTPNRGTVFLFGSSTIENVMNKTPYDLLVHLGFLPEYIHFKACIQQAAYWLVLMKHREVSHSRDHPLTEPSIVAATWDGVKKFVGRYYPMAKDEVTHHWDAILTQSIEHFEEQAGFKFINALEDVTGPAFMSYAKFRNLERPVTAWQVRLFLYCELRILELFSGDGFTYKENGEKGDQEYLAPNFKLSEIEKGNLIIIPLEIAIPEDVHNTDDRCKLRGNKP